eukprot:CAMPEP_0184496182 /NCGR_PEP_ID=MMETSP0113_2-20130426/33320_1 /TAXON_ID=91329 /ORGANISM="Norrisiella sphaerica, Strain BC52" /LENGTH=262 /DNA_ID=CAMNT_0026882699 /DNA_START=146 /DNA_END=934 /DNA_ORIENTATION=+
MIKDFHFDQSERVWQLTGRDGEDLGSFDWLAVSSSSVVHPRWAKIYGGPPPLEKAARELGDEAVNQTLNEISALEGNPVFVVMQAFEAMSALEALPANLLTVTGDPVLAKIVATLDSGLPSLALHSTHEFAQTWANTHGKGGTAEAMGARSDSGEEESVRSAIIESFQKTCEGLGVKLPDEQPCYGPALHRWGAAFPSNLPVLGDEQQRDSHGSSFDSACRVHAGSKLAFVGDYLAEPGGSVEQAFLSGHYASTLIADALAK